MPHINTMPGGHDLTVSAYVLRTDTPQLSVMLHKHKKLGVYLQFGGHVEPKENPWQAIAHELLEESGYEIGNLKILQPKERLKRTHGTILHPMPFGSNTHSFSDTHFHSDFGYPFVASSPPKHKPIKGESTDIRLFNVEQLKALNDNEIIENVRVLVLYVMEVLYKQWEPVDTSEFQL